MRKSVRFKIHNNVVQQSSGERVSNLTLHSPITVNAVLLLSQETRVRHFRGLPPIRLGTGVLGFLKLCRLFYMVSN